MSGGTLWLIPTPLGEISPELVLSSAVIERARSLRYFLAEEPKTARAFLKSIAHPGPISSLRIERLTLDTTASELTDLLRPLREAADAGLVSEAGCPALADPGAALVRLAHTEGVRVVPLAGPSSVVLALMASGLETQRFAFCGYLPIKDPARAHSIQALERRSREARETQIFIETPYRNEALFAALIVACRPDTLLCIASELTLPGESVLTRRVRDWRRSPPQLARRPSVFLLLSEGSPNATAARHPGSRSGPAPR